MNAAELAALLNGREYGNEITDAEERLAKEAGLVVLFGYSDDNVELRGAINDEVGCGEEDDLVIYGGQVWNLNECEDDCRFAQKANAEARKLGAKVNIRWDTDGYSWVYPTDIPHATFDVMEGDEKYCRGIVFSLADATSGPGADDK